MSPVLPDLIRLGLRVLICGTAAGPTSAAREHYYSGRQSDFYLLLFASGMTSRRLLPSEDGELPSFGIGLTDLAKHVSQSHDRGLTDNYDVPAFVDVIATARPQWVAFNGLEAARAFAKVTGDEEPMHGRQAWTIADCPVFVLPSSSGSNRGRNFARGSRGYDSEHPDRVAWWSELAALAGLLHESR